MAGWTRRTALLALLAAAARAARGQETGGTAEVTARRQLDEALRAVEQQTGVRIANQAAVAERPLSGTWFGDWPGLLARLGEAAGVWLCRTAPWDYLALPQPPPGTVSGAGLRWRCGRARVIGRGEPADPRRVVLELWAEADRDEELAALVGLDLATVRLRELPPPAGLPLPEHCLLAAAAKRRHGFVGLLAFAAPTDGARTVTLEWTAVRYESTDTVTTETTVADPVTVERDGIRVSWQSFHTWGGRWRARAALRYPPSLQQSEPWLTALASGPAGRWRPLSITPGPATATDDDRLECTCEADFASAVAPQRVMLQVTRGRGPLQRATVQWPGLTLPAGGVP
ncbi:MAG: hypothetical protein IT204_15040 [Fimbriimonadaceae bacterium]|nr:hypothetical protein [Fimbriimonadaceae bacterium]